MRKIKVYFHDNFSGLKSHSLLMRAAADYTSLSTEKLSLCRKEGKKPYFITPNDCFFSVSHSDNCWTTVFSDTEVGCDIQSRETKANPERIAKRYFHPDEYALFLNGGDFFSIWSKKEAFCKLFGWGIDANFANFSTLQNPTVFKNHTAHIKPVRLNENLPLLYIACGEEFEISGIIRLE